ncbi:hypothetical protein HYV87_03150 [Candidatus Woesearchaeota archaeon]|nr:hypothetical protein [Candidatus Woesearchaeota archaeon]MBI2582095.1 hypothetical protein [Candidatus Woesearchaeota archaeon]
MSSFQAVVVVVEAVKREVAEFKVSFAFITKTININYLKFSEKLNKHQITPNKIKTLATLFLASL